MEDIEALVAQLHQLASQRPDDQYKAAIALGRREFADDQTKLRVLQELGKALATTHQAVTRAHAAEALGNIGDRRALHSLIAALSDDYQLTRSYSARAVGKIGTTESVQAIPALIKMLTEDKFFGAQAEAAEALGKLRDYCGVDDAGRQMRESINNALDARRRKLQQSQLDREGRERRILAEIDRLQELKGLFVRLEATNDPVEVKAIGREVMGKLGGLFRLIEPARA
jgi:HEAT repeat protein